MSNPKTPKIIRTFKPLIKYLQLLSLYSIYSSFPNFPKWFLIFSAPSLPSKVIDTVLEGLDKAKSVRIVSDFSNEIGDAIMKDLDISVTYMKVTGGYSKQEKIITTNNKTTKTTTKNQYIKPDADIKTTASTTKKITNPKHSH